MKVRLLGRALRLAAVVLFVLAIIAGANTTAGTSLGVSVFVWLPAGLLALALDQLYGSTKR
jgi:hypothetical protein